MNTPLKIAIAIVVFSFIVLVMGYFFYLQRMTVLPGEVTTRVSPTVPEYQFPTSVPTPILTQKPSPTLPPGSPTPTGIIQSKSKLGIFLLSGYPEAARNIIKVSPRLIKVVDPHLEPTLMRAAEEYKKIYPEGIVVLRIMDKTKKYTLTDDPAKSATEYYTSILTPALEKIGDKKALYSYMESPNEVDNTPGWDTVESVTWLGTFWKTLIELNDKNGLKTCVGSIPVGNPGGSDTEVKEKMVAFKPALDAALATKSSICYHGYTRDYTNDPSTEYWFSLRHRMIHQAMIGADPKYGTIQFIISEAGVDQSGDPKTSGWKARGSETQFQNWLNWYDLMLRQDSYVIGATIFQIGDDYWESFDIEPVAGWLQSQINQE